MGPGHLSRTIVREQGRAFRRLRRSGSSAPNAGRRTSPRSTRWGAPRRASRSCSSSTGATRETLPRSSPSSARGSASTRAVSTSRARRRSALMKKDMGGAAHGDRARPPGDAARTCARCACSSWCRRWRTRSAAMRSAPATSFAHARASRSRSAIPMRKGASSCATRSRMRWNRSPATIIDFATLTGAARVALGPELPVLFANDDLPRRAPARRFPTPWRIRCGACRCMARNYRRLYDSEVADRTTRAAAARGEIVGALSPPTTSSARDHAVGAFRPPIRGTT